MSWFPAGRPDVHEDLVVDALTDRLSYAAVGAASAIVLVAI